MTDLSPSHSRRLPWTIGAGLFLCYSALECVGLLTSGEATTAYFIRYLIAYAMLCALWYFQPEEDRRSILSGLDLAASDFSLWGSLVIDRTALPSSFSPTGRRAGRSGRRGYRLLQGSE